MQTQRVTVLPLIALLSLLVNVGLYAQQVITVSPGSNLRNVQAEVRSKIEDMTQDIVVKLKDGTYRFDETLTFGQADGGTGQHKVIWRAENPGRVSFSGGKRVTGWTLHDSKKNIWKAKVGSREFRQFYVDGRMATRARTPSADENKYYSPYYERDLQVDLSDNTVRIPTAEVGNWARLNQVELVMMPHWYHQRVRIKSITPRGPYVTITPMDPERDNTFNRNNDSFYNANGDTFYYFENAYEFLNTQGEWYLNTDNETLYYIPYADQDMNKDYAVVPGNIETLVRIEGSESSAVKNITLEGINFVYTNWLQPSRVGLSMTQGNQIVRSSGKSAEGTVAPGAVVLRYVRNILLERNNFSKLGGVGVHCVAGTRNTYIRGNTFYDIASTGLVLGIGLEPKPILPRRVTRMNVSNNYFTRTGRNYTNANGILAGYVDHSVFEHNEIHDINYTGMQVGQHAGSKENPDVGMADNHIRYNEVYDVGQLHDDAGGIYTLAKQPGTHIFENYVHDHRRGPWAGTYFHAAIFLDNLSRGITVRRNVLENNDLDFIEQADVETYYNETDEYKAQSRGIKNRAGLQSAYKAIKAGVPPEAVPVPEQPKLRSSGPRVEAEDMDVRGATVETGRAYSGGAGVKPNTPRANTGEASFIFSGESGSYTVVVGYAKENDGQAQHKLFVNGKIADLWTATLARSGGLEAAERVVSAVTVNEGDVIRVTGTVTGGSHGRIDYVELHKTVDRIEVENMRLSNVAIETRWFHSNRKVVKPTKRFRKGTASFTAQRTGTYNFVLGYLLEDDGQAFHEVYVNDVPVDSWTADLSDGRVLQEEAHLTRNVAVRQGDVIEVTGALGGSSHGRMDYVEFVASSAVASRSALREPAPPTATEGVAVHPNPVVGGEVSFAISLQESGSAEISIYDTSGKLVTTIRRSFGAGGTHEVVLDARRDAKLSRSGLYTFVVQTDEYVRTGKLMVLGE